MATQFTIEIGHQPGTLARIGRLMGEAGVNIEAIQGLVIDRKGLVQFVVDKPDLAEQALREAGFTYRTRDGLLVDVMNEPGTLGDVALVMSEAGITVDAVYISMNGRLVMSVDDLDGAIQVAHGMAVL